MVASTHYQTVYRQIQVGTAGKEKLVAMLYNGAIVALQKAHKLLQARDYVEKGKAIFKAQDIVMELNLCLNEECGTIATNLRRLYTYIYRCLSEANVKNDSQKIEEVLRLLSGLRDAWVIAATRATAEAQEKRASMIA